MIDITKIDYNFIVNATIRKEGLAFYNADIAPFKVYGVKKDDGRYRRMPETVAASVSEGVHGLSYHTAGGCVRFRTNSDKIAIIAKMDHIGKMPHFPLTGSAGFDLYDGTNYVNTFVPPLDMTDGYESTLTLPDKQWRDITINFPLYSGVLELHIGLTEDAQVEAPKPYALEKPIVYYGSSITQGGCASRPGTAYQAFITRRFNVEHVNLGFSGSAKGEPEMIEYLASLDMAAFVLDYDANAPTAEHLQNTHEKLFKAVRATHPDLPIIMLPRPSYTRSPEQLARRDIIKTTYENALAAGDKNVWFIDADVLLALAKDDATVDRSHPTDFGFYSMALAVGDVIGKIFGF